MDAVKVIISNDQKAVKVPTGIRMLIRRCCHAVLQLEGFKGSAEVSVRFVDNEQIRELNTAILIKKQMFFLSRLAKTENMILTTIPVQSF